MFCPVQVKAYLFYHTKHNELRGIHRQIIHVCVKKQSAVKPRVAIGEKEEAALIAVSWRNAHLSLPLPHRPQYPPKFQSFHQFQADITVYFCWFYFLKFKFTYFRHNCHSGALAQGAAKQSRIPIWVQAKGNPWVDFLMVIMASGMARGRVRTTGTEESRNMAAIIQIIAWQKHAAWVYCVLLWFCTSMLWSIGTCQNKVSTDPYYATMSWA